MKQESGEMGLRQRIRAGEVRRQDVARRLAELAFGRSNDCVRLVLDQTTDLSKLDLALLAEVKRSDKGSVEVKLIDRLQVLEQLAALTGKEDGEMDAFLRSLQGGEEA